MIDHKTNFSKNPENSNANKSVELTDYPGPGYYDDSHNNPRFKKVNNDWSFSSALDRFKSDDEIVPHIGEYEVSAHDISKSKRMLRKNKVNFDIFLL